jgi:electron transfer flavoprotein alpha subunit
VKHVAALAMLLRPRTAGSFRAFLRAYSSAPPPHALVFLEHRQGVIDSGSLSALTAAEQLGGQVTGLIVGGPEHVPGAVEKAKK